MVAAARHLEIIHITSSTSRPTESAISPPSSIASVVMPLADKPLPAAPWPPGKPGPRAAAILSRAPTFSALTQNSRAGGSRLFLSRFFNRPLGPCVIRTGGALFPVAIGPEAFGLLASTHAGAGVLAIAEGAFCHLGPRSGLFSFKAKLRRRPLRALEILFLAQPRILIPSAAGLPAQPL